MANIKKMAEKELEKAKKNPGKANREKQKELNSVKRGEPIPPTRITETKKTKEKKRQNLKKKLRDELSEE